MGIINKIVHKAKLSLNQANASVKERIFDFTGTNSATIPQLADYIQKHPDTKMKRKVLLGNMYSVYELNSGDIFYYLEKRNANILQLDVQSQAQDLITYRSYKDQYTLNTPIKIPEK
ncbi:hypothetical protein JOC77_003986 [Peribacillus deserti]|uniref:Uncharacterized protein n=1 Tax=Peribacillus deserti TaxID=673318 RepID=A0ABS2QPZ1_9BACI|nr:hypothetical protein [Peribacillus deserti]MBM7694523.1 hypothetical protein [Peribacillus deserti]